MPGSRIPALTAIAGASTANDDNLVIFDTSTDTTKRILRSQLAVGLVGDLPYTPAGFIAATTVPTAIAEIASDVAASGGSNLVGFLQAGTGAVTTTVQAKLRESVSVFDFMTAAQIADVQANTAAIDVTAAIQAALDSVAQSTGAYDVQIKSRGGTIFLPPGAYRVSASLNGRAGTKLLGAGPNISRIVSELISGNVISFLGVDAGSVDPVEIEELAVVQKLGITHTSGYAISIDGNSFGTTPRLRNVMTQDTYGGIYLDWCFPGSLDNCHAFRHAIEGFKTRFSCTSITFQNCYAGACAGSGFKIAGNYMSLVNCASDSNTLDGYEFYYDGGASVSMSMVSCGSEVYSRNGISTDRIVSISIIAPRLITGTSGLSCLNFNGGDAITVVSPVLSSQAANANACINVSNTSGAYPSNIQLFGFSGTTTNYATIVNLPDYVFWPGSRSNVGMYNNTFRLGGIGAFNQDLQTFQIGTNFPAGSGGTAYAANYVPVATAAFSLAAASHYKPVINAPALTLARVIAGPYVEAPTVTAGTVTRHEGLRINDQPAGGSADANLALGDAAVALGRWSIYNISARTNLFGAGIRWGTSTGALTTFGAGTPEGAVTAPVGSTYQRTDGGAGTSFYVKESGTGNTGWVGK